MAKVLVIESEASTAQALSDALAQQGHQVIATGDGAEAVKLALDRRPELIILCVELARGSGYSVCNKLKKDAELASVPLILTSSQATDETFEQHKKLRTRAEAYLKKPYAMAELLKLSAQYLGRKRGGAELEVELADVSVENMADDRSGRSLASSLDDDLELTLASTRPAARTHATPGRSSAALVSDADSDKARGENRQLRQKLQQLEKTLQDKELEFNDRLLEESGRARDSVDLKKRIAQLEREMTRYQQTAEKATGDAERAKLELTRTRGESGGVEKERQVLSDKIGQLVDKVKSLAAERDRLQARIEELERAAEGLRNDVENASKVRERAKRAVDIAMQLLDETGLVN